MSTAIKGDAVTYTCRECGAHEFYVEELYDVTWNYTHVLDCDCEASEDVAARRSMHRTDSMKRVGDLDEEHRVPTWEEPEKIDAGEPEEDESETLCVVCVAEAEESDWRLEDDGSETDEEEFFVRCGGCHREIEFGWSHPDRGGRFWPVDASDFNPWKSWPEPRYVESWRAKGWLRPTTPQGQQPENR